MTIYATTPTILVIADPKTVVNKLLWTSTRTLIINGGGDFSGDGGGNPLPPPSRLKSPPSPSPLCHRHVHTCNPSVWFRWCHNIGERKKCKFNEDDSKKGPTWVQTVSSISDKPLIDLANGTQGFFPFYVAKMGYGTSDLVMNNPLEWTMDNEMRDRESIVEWIGECRVRGVGEVMAYAGTSPHVQPRARCVTSCTFSSLTR
jgi:hypothetical protein